MWVVTKTNCEKNHGIDRTLEVIRSKWKEIAPEFQHYIEARELVATKLPSGRTIEEVGDQVMHL